MAAARGLRGFFGRREVRASLHQWGVGREEGSGKRGGCIALHRSTHGCPSCLLQPIEGPWRRVQKSSCRAGGSPALAWPKTATVSSELIPLRHFGCCPRVGPRSPRLPAKTFSGMGKRNQKVPSPSCRKLSASSFLSTSASETPPPPSKRGLARIVPPKPASIPLAPAPGSCAPPL